VELDINSATPLKLSATLPQIPVHATGSRVLKSPFFKTPQAPPKLAQRPIGVHAPRYSARHCGEGSGCVVVAVCPFAWFSALKWLAFWFGSTGNYGGFA